MFARLMGALGGVLLSTGVAVAQQEYSLEKLKTKPEDTVIPWVIGAVFLVASLVVGFKPAKRSNLR